MELEQLTKHLIDIYDSLGLEWVDYGPPSEDDLAVAVAGMVDYLDGTQLAEGEYGTIELPGAGLIVKRYENTDEVWVKIGTVDVDPPEVVND